MYYRYTNAAHKSDPGRTNSDRNALACAGLDKLTRCQARVAAQQGFEPQELLHSTDFKAVSLNHSDTTPQSTRNVTHY